MSNIKSYRIGQKYYAHVTGTEYTTPGYLTKQMADADAKCWKAFHVTETPKKGELSIDVSDMVYTTNADDGKVNRKREWTGPKFATWLTNMLSKYPSAKFQVGTEFAGQTAKGSDFYLTIQLTPNAPKRAFYVEK